MMASAGRSKKQTARKGGQSGAPRAEQPRSGPSEAAIVAELRAAVQPLKAAGFDAPAEERARIAALLGDLEDLNDVAKPTRSARLWGEWRLVYTDSPPMIKNRGVTVRAFCEPADAHGFVSFVVRTACSN